MISTACGHIASETITALRAPQQVCANRWRQSLAISCAVVALVAASVARAADTVPPSHECVPDETVLVVRVPQAKKFLDALRSQTKLGSVVLSDKRYEKILDFIREQAADALTEASAELAKYNLKVEDFPTVFDREIGFALVVQPRKDTEKFPLMMGLWWLEPNTDLGERLVKAIGQMIDDQKDEPNAIRRVDLDLEGRQVMHLIMPITSSAPYPEGAFEGLEKLSPEELKAKLAELRKDSEDKDVVTDQMHVFITRVGDRLLIGNTFPTSEEEVQELREEDEDKEPDFDTITGLEEATPKAQAAASCRRSWPRPASLPRCPKERHWLKCWPRRNRC
jgi:hypothetical protein